MPNMRWAVLAICILCPCAYAPNSNIIFPDSPEFANRAGDSYMYSDEYLYQSNEISYQLLKPLISDDVIVNFGSRMGEEGNAAGQCVCKPLESTVPLILEDTDNSSVEYQHGKGQPNSILLHQRNLNIYAPECAIVKRCGGCCPSSTLACEPIEKKTTSIQVKVYRYNRRLQNIEHWNTKTIEVEEHTKCRCGCVVKPSDCKSWKPFSEPDCLCKCRPKICRNDQFMNYRTCKCMCKDSKARKICTTVHGAEGYDERTCKCVSSES